MLKPWLYLIIVISSLVFKVVTVDNGFFWRDEIFTINQTSGRVVFSLCKTEPLNEIKRIAYYKQLLKLNELPITVGSQLKEQSKNTNLNPLHYSFLTIWHRVVGDEPVHYRYFSILMFLLCLPVLFLFVKRLFGSNLAAWIAISLFSVSPYFHYYALEARYNMLLAFLLISSHYVLLLAIEQNKLKHWGMYILTGVMVLYTSLTAGVVLFGHFLFVMLFKKKIRNKYVLAGMIIILCYLPWIIAIINNRGQISNALSWHMGIKPESLSQFRMFIIQLLAIGRSFVSISLPADWVSYILFSGKLQLVNLLNLIANIFVLLVLVYSIIFLSKNLPKAHFWFIALITIPLLLFFFIVDLFRGSVSSCIERYQLAIYLGTLLFVTGLLSSKISQKRMAYVLLYLLFAVFGIYSMSKIAADRHGLCIGANLRIVSTADFISEAESPLIITSGEYLWGDRFSLINELESESIDILYVTEDIEIDAETISVKEYSNVYILMVTNPLIKNLGTQFENKIVKIENNSIIPTWELHLNSWEP